MCKGNDVLDIEEREFGGYFPSRTSKVGKKKRRQARESEGKRGEAVLKGKEMNRTNMRKRR